MATYPAPTKNTDAARLVAQLQEMSADASVISSVFSAAASQPAAWPHLDTFWVDVVNEVLTVFAVVDSRRMVVFELSRDGEQLVTAWPLRVVRRVAVNRAKGDVLLVVECDADVTTITGDMVTVTVETPEAEDGDGDDKPAGVQVLRQVLNGQARRAGLRYRATPESGRGDELGRVGQVLRSLLT